MISTIIHLDTCSRADHRYRRSGAGHVQAGKGIAFGFGLLHGFGFASGLSTTGMPRAELPWAPLWFNIGVELGQLLFVAVALGLVWAFAVLRVRWPRWVWWLPGYTVGSLGAYWTIQRTTLLLGGL